MEKLFATIIYTSTIRYEELTDQLFISIILNTSTGFKKILIGKNGIIINDHKYPFSIVDEVTGEITKDITITGKVKERAPLGKVIIKLKGGLEISFETINPLEKAEKIVLFANSYLRENNEPLLIIEEESRARVKFTRESKT